MTKNVFVVDEQGNSYGATYPKRAKGLVKNGRARFIDENTICLARPPKQLSEEKQMTDINKIAEESVLSKETPTVIEYSIPYVLLQIRQIQENTQHLHEVIEGLLELPESVSSVYPGVVTKAGALCDIVKCRETTNQQLICLYEKMYEDLRPQKTDAKMDSLERMICNLASVYSGEELSEVITSLQELYK